MRARMQAVVLFALAGCLAPREERFEFEERKLGTMLRLVFYAPDAETAQRAAEEAFARVDALDEILSDYDEESELARLSRSTGVVELSRELGLALALAREVSERTGGAFDVTVGPFVDLWRRARRHGELPSAERLALAARSVGFEKLELEGTRARLAAEGMRLDLGGIGKGFVADELLRLLRARGLARALVDAGGDLALGDPPPGRAGWRIELEPMEGERLWLELACAGVATSGDTYRYIELDGVRYSHVVDPRTGLGVARRTAATVIAPDGARADAWATALCVLGPGGIELVERAGGVEARVVTEEDVRVSRGFPIPLSSANTRTPSEAER